MWDNRSQTNKAFKASHATGAKVRENAYSVLDLKANGVK